MGWLYNLVSKFADATDSSKGILKDYPHYERDIKILEYQEKVQRQTALMSKMIVKGTNLTYAQYMEKYYGKSKNETLYDFIDKRLKEGKKIPHLILEK